MGAVGRKFPESIDNSYLLHDSELSIPQRASFYDFVFSDGDLCGIFWNLAHFLGEHEMEL
jgi:hypothetical protein